MTVRVEIDRGAANELFNTGRREALTRAAELVTAEARRLAPGSRLPESIHYTIEGDVAHVGSDLPEAEWVEKGTGVFGPHHTPIVPVTKKVMMFQVRGAKVFAHQVQGQPARPFLEPALEVLNNRIL